ncbi:MAG TPA: asparagine synthase C-terminal domain-containing protein [Steroidobacteraceae bacterium]|nr:asparagine synthase C-terminal domain-containing protein [Steroidobacteraceae bacterium]
MFRYVAFVWNDQDTAARESARLLLQRHSATGPEWRVAVRAGGIEVRCAKAGSDACAAYLLAEEGGVVLGTLFARSQEGVSTAAPFALSEAESRAMQDSNGRHLIESYWGRYVAFLHDAQARATWVLRDPSGGLPCYLVRCRGVDVYFSWMDDIVDLLDAPLEINWSYLIAAVCFLREHSAGTGLREITQVLAGECVETRAGASKRFFYWDPLAVANTDVIDDLDAAVAAMRQCVRDVVHAWATCYDHVLLSLSGGLDSSIVLACLKDAPSRPRVTCFHYYPLGADLDERAFARAAAAKAGLELLERPRDSSFDLQPLLTIHRAPEPTNYPYFLEHSRLDAQLAAEHGAAAVVIGYGGDQLFYQERAEWAPGDFLHRRGLRPSLLRVALDAAQMDQISVWRVLREAASGYLADQRWSVLQEAGRMRPLLVPAVIEEARRSAGFLHPLLRHPRGAPSGKLWHAHQISQPFDFYDPLAREGDAERISPLFSQPVMELCLRIPTYVLTDGGWDRAVARRAFYDELPPEIRNRRHKGGIEEHLRLTLEHNRAFLRELLLDGALVREGVIDRGRVAEVLSGRATPIGTGSGEVLEYAGIEAWLKRWGTIVRRAAA